jgi:hypothetical protein
MRKRAISVVIVLCIILGLFPSVAIAAGSMLFAEPSKTNFVMDGKSVSVTQAYNVNDNNYLQLRAIAELLNGTISQFNMYWDGTYAVIETGQPFNGTVNPATLTYTENVRKSRTSFKLDGTLITFENVYMIDGDTNYLQLREFAEKLKGTASQFNVYWDDAKNEAVIVPGEAYTGKPPAGFTSIKKGQTEQEAGIGNKLLKVFQLPTASGDFMAVMKNSLPCTTWMTKRHTCTPTTFPSIKTAVKYT